MIYITNDNMIDIWQIRMHVISYVCMHAHDTIEYSNLLEHTEITDTLGANVNLLGSSFK